MFCLSSPQFFRIFFRITRVSWNCSDILVMRTLFLVPPDIQGLWQCPGELSSEVLSSQFYCCNSGIPDFVDIENLFYAISGEITSTPPSTGAGVREYCHNLYNGCFSKVEVNDFRRFLGYVLTDGYSWIQGLLVWVIYFVSPVSPTPDCITRKFREFIGGIQVALSISSRRYLVCDWVILTTYLFQSYLVISFINLLSSGFSP